MPWLRPDRLLLRHAVLQELRRKRQGSHLRSLGEPQRRRDPFWCSWQRAPAHKSGDRRRQLLRPEGGALLRRHRQKRHSPLMSRGLRNWVCKYFLVDETGRTGGDRGPLPTARGCRCCGLARCDTEREVDDAVHCLDVVPREWQQKSSGRATVRAEPDQATCIAQNTIRFRRTELLPRPKSLRLYFCSF